MTLTARTANASGVAFDAYYADNPANVNTIGWHTLGEARLTGNGDWSMVYETHAILDQGSAALGTVVITAIALNERGEPTPARDWRRVDVSNPTTSSPPPAPPPPPTSYPFRVVGTCGEGARP